MTPTVTRNVLFVMCDQLRADVLSCYRPGGALQTPHIDRLAAMGVRFDRAHVSSAVCGPSRASYYTGRYPASHRVTWNRVPMPIDEWSLGDYLAQHGRECHLLGKTHFVPDARGLKQRGLEVSGAAAVRFRQGGFTPIERYDGHFEMHADSPYRQHLLARGYQSDRPWEDYVIGSLDQDGALASGWYLRNAGLPARVDRRDSETAYLTDRAIDFIRARGDTPWTLHLSYIKPHWPYKAPAPYHAMFGTADCAPPVRSEQERSHAHPVQAAYQKHEESEAFARDEAWQTIKPVYLGLVKQIDDEFGRLLDVLDAAGRMQDTLIVFSSDHGDHLGDHWLGEKEVFFDSAMRVPLIVYDPDARAAPTRGTVSNQFAECVDVVPTILDALGILPASQRIEGQSLLPWLRGETAETLREVTVGTLDYAYREARLTLGRDVNESHGTMVRDDRYKLMLWQGYRPQLFDLHDDPDELHDIGNDPAKAPVQRRLRDALEEWHLRRRQRATESDAEVAQRTHAHERMMNILIGRW